MDHALPDQRFQFVQEQDFHPGAVFFEAIQASRNYLAVV